MTIETIQSSWFEAQYNTDNQLCIIKPIKGKDMQYIINPQIWESWKNSESKGKFYNDNIKGNF